MSSVLSLFWSSKPTPASTPADPQVQPSASLSSSSSTSSLKVAPASIEEKEDGDESFVLVDAPMAQTPKDMECSTPSVMVEPVAAVVAEAPKAAAAPPAPSSSRTCRPYGHAHSPPALLAPSPAAVPVVPLVAAISTSSTVAAPSSSASSSSSSSKRSFASVACTTPPAASSTGIIAYAEDASISLAEQLKAKIDQLSAEVALSVAAAAEAEEQQRAEATLRLPLLSRGVSGSSGPVERPLDAKLDWALGVDEPKSKRAKRTAASSNAPLLLSKAEQAAKAAKFKGKPHKVARKEDKEMRRAREDKEGSEISAQ